MFRCIVLISGTGSNLQAMCKFGLAKNICMVISNNPNALGLDIAKAYNIPTHLINHKKFNSRVEFELALATIIKQLNPNYIILAGFMRILSSEFVNQYANK